MIAPLRFQITSQPRTSDAHVYGGRSRFLTEKVLKAFDESAFQGSHLSEIALEAAEPLAVDVKSRLKQMW